MMAVSSPALRGEGEAAAASPSPAESVEALPPVPKDYFTDYAHATTEATRRLLNGQLADFEKKTTNQVVVVIFQHKTSPTPLREYCTAISNQWKVGQKGKNNGVVLFIFKDDRKLWIATGSGMATVLPDRECQRIIDEMIVPAFRKGDFDGGCVAGVAAILQSITARQTPQPSPAQ